jgi:hypothetical protein
MGSKTYSGVSEVMSLKLSDVPGHYGFWNMTGLSTVGFLAVVALTIGIIITGIVLACTKACKSCRDVEYHEPTGGEVVIDETNTLTPAQQKRNDRMLKS